MSPAPRVVSALIALVLMFSEKNRTLPSPMAKWHPPGWKLENPVSRNRGFPIRHLRRPIGHRREHRTVR